MIFYRLDNAAGTMQYDRMPNRSGNTTNYRVVACWEQPKNGRCLFHVKRRIPYFRL